jgi:hypothetical protein
MVSGLLLGLIEPGRRPSAISRGRFSREPYQDVFAFLVLIMVLCSDPRVCWVNAYQSAHERRLAQGAHWLRRDRRGRRTGVALVCIALAVLPSR